MPAGRVPDLPPLESLGEQQPLRESLVILSGQGPCEQKPSLANCRFHTLAPGFLEGFSVRYLSVCAVNAVVPDDPQKELVVRRPELPIVSVTRGPRHAPVQKSLHGLRLYCIIEDREQMILFFSQHWCRTTYKIQGNDPHRKSLSRMGPTRERWRCTRDWMSRLDMNTCQTCILREIQTTPYTRVSDHLLFSSTGTVITFRFQQSIMYLIS